MASNNKRLKYVSDNELSSSDYENLDNPYYLQEAKTVSRKGKSKWLSKNAIMARENRRKKKMYLSNLEHENKKLQLDSNNFSKIIDNQSQLISDLKREVKYLKSVIANSNDISKLMKNIQHSTGMSVTTSLDETLSLNNYVSKRELPIARKTAHPWEDSPILQCLTPESEFCDELGSSNLLFENLPPLELLDEPNDFTNQVAMKEESGSPLEEHSYTTIKEEHDVGVCLHVSNHRVSLEFCSTCSSGAIRAWNNKNC